MEFRVHENAPWTAATDAVAEPDTVAEPAAGSKANAEPVVEPAVEPTALWHVRIAAQDRRATHVLREFGWLLGDVSGLVDVPATLAIEVQAVHAARMVAVLVPLYIDATALVRSASLPHATHITRRGTVRMLHPQTGIELLPFHTQLGCWLASEKLTTLLVESFCTMADLPEREELAYATDLLQALFPS